MRLLPALFAPAVLASWHHTSLVPSARRHLPTRAARLSTRRAPGVRCAADLRRRIADALSGSQQAAVPDVGGPDVFAEMEAGTELCLLPFYQDDAVQPAGDAASAERFRLLLTAWPLLAPVVAFFTYEWVRDVFHALIASARTWYSVDGGATEIALITPVINGVVNPAVSVVLGTLIAATLNQLRMRQVNIRTCLNREACGIRALERAVNLIYSEPRDAETRRKLLAAMRQYTSRLIIETRGSWRASVSPTTESELDAMMEAVARSPKPSAALAQTSRFYEPALFALPSMMQDLNNHRSQRLSEQQSAYPAVHWLILSLLGLSVLVSFLIESDEATVQFLDSLQLRLLYTILWGVAAAASSLCADLNDPFRGNFRITPSADQLYVIRETLTEEICSELFDSSAAIAAAAAAAAAEERHVEQQPEGAPGRPNARTQGPHTPGGGSG